jgi:recombination protein RecT
MTSNKQGSYDRVKSWLDNEAMRDVLRKTLPRNVPVDPWVQAALTTIRLDVKLLNCEPLSLMGALMTVASLGLRLEGPLGQAYLSARAVREKNPQTGRWEISHYEAQAQIGYRGFIDIAYRDPDVREVESIIVHHDDEFDFRRGSEPFVHHRWDHRKTPEERGPMVAVYSGLRFKAGYYSFEVYPFSDILVHRNKILAEKGIRVETGGDGNERYLRKGDRGEYEMNYQQIAKQPWLAFPIPMIKKTPIRWSAKYWPLSPDFQRAADLASLEEANVSQQLADIARTTLPSVIASQLEANAPNEGKLADAQNLSLAKTKGLAAKMAAEAAARDGKAPQGDDSDDAAQDKAEGDNGQQAGAEGDMSDEEKADALRMEAEEAEREEAERKKQLGIDD